MLRSFCLAIRISAVALILSAFTRLQADEYLVFLGSYSTADEPGIHVLKYNEDSGDVAVLHKISGVISPSFLAIHPSHRYLYAVIEVEDTNGSPSGGVTSFDLNPKTGDLKKKNTQLTGGPGPCHLIVDPAGKHVLAANYSGGSVCVIALENGGALGKQTAFVQHQGGSVDKSRQEGPHAHSINLDASGRFAFVADLGKDEVLIYQYDGGKGTLTPNSPSAVRVKAGGGPRHFCFHPSGKFAYTNLEMTSEVTAFRFDSKTGSLEEIQRLTTVPEGGFPGNSTAEVLVSPDGKHLYCSNRGHDTLAGYSIDPSTGKLTFIDWFSTGGKTPRNFNITPSGKSVFAANQSSNNVLVLLRNEGTGKLSPTKHLLEIPKAVCVKFLKLGGTDLN